MKNYDFENYFCIFAYNLHMKTRLRKLMSLEGLTAARLAEIAGVQPSTVSHILSGRNYPSFEFIANLLKAYPLLDPRWLVLGEGDTYVNNQNVNPIVLPESNDQEKERVTPVINIENDGIINNQNTDNQQDVAHKRAAINRVEVAEKIVIFYTDGTFSLYKNE